MSNLNLKDRLNDIRSQVSAKEVERDAILAKYGITLEQSEKEHKDFCKDPFDFAESIGDMDRITPYSNQKEIDQLNSTLESGVTLVTTQYLITDSTLVSAAGFHPSEPVYLTNEIMIQTDRLPNHVGEGLSVYHIAEITTKWQD